MEVLLMHDYYDKDHLENVKKTMETMGTPTIKAFLDPAYDIYIAMEGCHRLRAAKELGLTPIFDLVEYTDDIVCDNEQTVVEIVDSAFYHPQHKFTIVF
jgi:hypothetical protein